VNEKCHQLFGRDLNTVLHVVMHHAQLGGRVLLHNKVNFLKRSWEVIELLQWTGQWVGGNTPPPYSWRQKRLHRSTHEGRIFAYRLWHCGSIDNVSTTLHKLQLGSLPPSRSAELKSLQRAIEHCIMSCIHNWSRRRSAKAGTFLNAVMSVPYGTCDEAMWISCPWPINSTLQ